MAAEYIFLAQVVFFLIPLTRGRHVLNTLETPIREALLKPRNFNPHPFYPYDTSASSLEPIHDPYSPVLDNSVFDGPASQQIVRNSPPNGIHSQGPVQFPPQEPNEIRDIKNFPHPYARLKSKGDPRQNTNLAVLEDSDDESLTKKHYAFSYTVRDSASGDDFSHSQQQNNGAVKGTYKVQLPDGRTQVVTYTADSDGYRADVSYLNGGSTDGVPSSHSTGQRLQPIQPSQNYYSSSQFNNGHQNNYISSNQHGSININPYSLVSPSVAPSYNSYQSYEPNSGVTPTPPTSSIYVSTSKPIYNDGHDELTPLSANLDYSTAGSGTYVVSSKSTQIHSNSNYEYSPDYDFRENGLAVNNIVQREATFPEDASQQQALYFKSAK